ncbi:MAG: Mu transposase C-terminal domain-containing protein [Candidatus Syntrophopropionicum ammoniitolerans]
MSQADRIKLFSDPSLLDEHFLLRAQRKVNHDATLSLDKILYETDASLAGSRLEVRYEPQWLDNPARPVFLYQDGAKVGEARQVNLAENASSKERGGADRLRKKTRICHPLPMKTHIPLSRLLPFSLMKRKHLILRGQVKSNVYPVFWPQVQPL